VPEIDQRTLIILSDFLEDDNNYRFTSDQHLASPDGARRLAMNLRNEHSFFISCVMVHFGQMQSSDFARLNSARQGAIRAFWTEYFNTAPEQFDIQMDGTAALRRF